MELEGLVSLPARRIPYKLQLFWAREVFGAADNIPNHVYNISDLAYNI